MINMENLRTEVIEYMIKEYEIFKSNSTLYSVLSDWLNYDNDKELEERLTELKRVVDKVTP